MMIETKGAPVLVVAGESKRSWLTKASIGRFDGRFDGGDSKTIRRSPKDAPIRRAVQAFAMAPSSRTRALVLRQT
jgi:hypothetical protein